jgi:endonuclease YncB( thermonuclease family)
MITLRKIKYFFLGIRARMGSAEDLDRWTAQIDKVIDGTKLEMQKQERF